MACCMVLFSARTFGAKCILNYKQNGRFVQLRARLLFVELRAFFLHLPDASSFFRSLSAPFLLLSPKQTQLLQRTSLCDQLLW